MRDILTIDEFKLPQHTCKYPRMSDFLVDEISYYYSDIELESPFVVEAEERKSPILSIELKDYGALQFEN